MLTALVVSSILASGIFTLPRSLAAVTGPLALLLAWALTGFGMLMIARVLQWLAEQRPDLDAGVFSYAKAGFGAYAGFLAALGYWAGTCLFNVAYFVLIKGTLGAVIPGFGHGNTIQAVVASSLLLWTIHMLLLRGVKEAAIVNGLVTLAKVAAVAGAVLILIFGFDGAVMAGNVWEGGAYGPADIPSQIRSAMIVTVYAFIGIEAASVLSRYAKRREDVGRASLWGLAIVSTLFILVTLLAYGILPRAELQALRQPSLSRLVAEVVGPLGAMAVSLGMIVAAAGAFLSRSMLSAEVLWAAANAGTMPRRFAVKNARRVPEPALWVSSGLVQAFLLLSLLAEDAYTIAYTLTSAMMLLPYLLVAAFGLKLAWHRAVQAERGGTPQLTRAVLATLFAAFLVWAAGIDLLLAMSLIYAVGTGLFVLARREQRLPVFRGMEAAVFALLAAGALAFFAGRFAGWTA
jgi:arginine:ornithine antiporter/lysine permease